MHEQAQNDRQYYELFSQVSTVTIKCDLLDCFHFIEINSNEL